MVVRRLPVRVSKKIGNLGRVNVENQKEGGRPGRAKELEHCCGIQISEQFRVIGEEGRRVLGRVLGKGFKNLKILLNFLAFSLPQGSLGLNKV